MTSDSRPLAGCYTLPPVFPSLTSHSLALCAGSHLLLPGLEYRHLHIFPSYPVSTEAVTHCQTATPSPGASREPEVTTSSLTPGVRGNVTSFICDSVRSCGALQPCTTIETGPHHVTSLLTLPKALGCLQAKTRHPLFSPPWRVSWAVAEHFTLEPLSHSPSPQNALILSLRPQLRPHQPHHHPVL